MHGLINRKVNQKDLDLISIHDGGCECCSKRLMLVPKREVYIDWLTSTTHTVQLSKLFVLSIAYIRDATRSQLTSFRPEVLWECIFD